MVAAQPHQASDHAVGRDKMPDSQVSQGRVPDTVPFHVMLTGKEQDEDDMEIALEKLMLKEDDEDAPVLAKTRRLMPGANTHTSNCKKMFQRSADIIKHTLEWLRGRHVLTTQHHPAKHNKHAEHSSDAISVDVGPTETSDHGGWPYVQWENKRQTHAAGCCRRHLDARGGIVTCVSTRVSSTSTMMMAVSCPSVASPLKLFSIEFTISFVVWKESFDG